MSTDVVRLGHVYLTGASPNGARQAEGKGREEPVGGCGTLAIGPGLSIAEGCGQHSRPRAGAGSSDSDHLLVGFSIGFLAMVYRARRLGFLAMVLYASLGRKAMLNKDLRQMGWRTIGFLAMALWPRMTRVRVSGDGLRIKKD